MKVIAYIHTDFPDKFGVPRQSGLVGALQAQIIFTPPYRNRDAVRGLDSFSHLWLIWEFSRAVREQWSPTVRPPRLGGNQRMGVFATRSPFRPNPIGLSSVKLEKIEYDPALGPILHVSGIDMVDGTPIYDIKPYLSFTDSHPEALSGFASDTKDYALAVTIPPEELAKVPLQHQSSLIELLSQDPRPSYQQDSQRIYGLQFAGMEVKFTVDRNDLYVKSIALPNKNE